MFKMQEQIRHNNDFSKRIGAVFEKFPLAKSLWIGDIAKSHRRTPWDEVNDDETHFRNLTAPISWNAARHHRLGFPPTHELVDIPVSIQQAGVYLTKLHIDLNPIVDDMSLEVAVNHDFTRLATALQGLKYLRFDTPKSKSSIWEPPTPDVLMFPSKLISTLINTGSLAGMSLQLGCMWDPMVNSSNFHLGSLISFGPWEHLQKIELICIPVTSNDLELLVRGIPTPANFHLAQIHLLDGSWIEILDMLRTKAGSRTSFEFPSGAEFKGLTQREWDYLLKNACLGGPDCEGNCEGVCYSRIEEYLRGFSDANSLRRVKEEAEARKG